MHELLQKLPLNVTTKACRHPAHRTLVWCLLLQMQWRSGCTAPGQLRQAGARRRTILQAAAIALSRRYVLAAGRHYQLASFASAAAGVADHAACLLHAVTQCC